MAPARNSCARTACARNNSQRHTLWRRVPVNIMPIVSVPRKILEARQRAFIAHCSGCATSLRACDSAGQTMRFSAPLTGRTKPSTARRAEVEQDAAAVSARTIMLSGDVAMQKILGVHNVFWWQSARSDRYEGSSSVWGQISISLTPGTTLPLYIQQRSQGLSSCAGLRSVDLIRVTAPAAAVSGANAAERRRQCRQLF